MFSPAANFNLLMPSAAANSGSSARSAKTTNNFGDLLKQTDPSPEPAQQWEPEPMPLHRADSRPAPETATPREPATPPESAEPTPASEHPHAAPSAGPTQERSQDRSPDQQRASSAEDTGEEMDAGQSGTPTEASGRETEAGRDAPENTPEDENGTGTETKAATDAEADAAQQAAAALENTPKPMTLGDETITVKEASQGTEEGTANTKQVGSQQKNPQSAPIGDSSQATGKVDGSPDATVEAGTGAGLGATPTTTAVPGTPGSDMTAQGAAGKTADPLVQQAGLAAASDVARQAMGAGQKGSVGDKSGKTGKTGGASGRFSPKSAGVAEGSSAATPAVGGKSFQAATTAGQEAGSAGSGTGGSGSGAFPGWNGETVLARDAAATLPQPGGSAGGFGAQGSTGGSGGLPGGNPAAGQAGGAPANAAPVGVGGVAGTVPGTPQASATGQSATPQGARSASPANQIAMQLTKGPQPGGKETLTVKLQPQHLGTVEIRLEVGQDGRVQAMITAERPETLEWLQRDARVLERSLQDAGMKTDSNSLNFERQQQRFAEEGSDGRGGGRGGNRGPDSGEGEATQLSELPAEEMVTMMLSANGNVDIRV